VHSRIQPCCEVQVQPMAGDGLVGLDGMAKDVKLVFRSAQASGLPTRILQRAADRWRAVVAGAQASAPSSGASDDASPVAAAPGGHAADCGGDGSGGDSDMHSEQDYSSDA
jgi:hypothetical protein